MTLIAIVAHAVGVLKFASDGARTFLWLSVASGVVNLWSYGILTNYRTDEKTPAVPTMLNFLTFITGAVLLILAFFREDLDRLITS